MKKWKSLNLTWLAAEYEVIELRSNNNRRYTPLRHWDQTFDFVTMTTIYDIKHNLYRNDDMWM